MAPIEHRSFADEIVELDSSEFRNCTFKRCTLVYRGGCLRLRSCNFEDCKWRFDDAADRTCKFLRAMYAGGDLPVKDAVESLLSYLTGSSTKPEIGGIDGAAPPSGSLHLEQLASGEVVVRKHIIYSGGESPADCRFEHCSVGLAGAARETIRTVRGIHRIGDRYTVDTLLNYIRTAFTEPLKDGSLSLTATGSPIKPQPPLHLDPEELDRLLIRIGLLLGNRFEHHMQRY